MLALLLIATLSSPQAQFWYGELLAAGGYGRLPHERAAFLIRESDGSLSAQPWPNGGHRHASYRGAVPARTVAIVHTHPKDEPRPSARDRQEARRLGLAVVVVTPESAIAALPDGTETIVARKPAPASETSRAPSARRTFLRR